MTPAQLDEARRWVALLGWRWKPGMLAVRVRDRYHDPPDAGTRIGRVHRVLYVVNGGVWCDGEAFHAVHRDFVPDVTDDGTQGCLKALAREILGDPDLFARPSLLDEGWIARGCVALSEHLVFLSVCELHERTATPEAES